jgi:glutathione S-transferase
MLTLEYTAGSPYARAIRILLHELDLEYVGSEPRLAPTPTQLGANTPTMQVPTLRDGDVVLWESGTVAEYLLSKYSTRVEEEHRLASEIWRPEHEWEDKLLFSTVQTFGAAVTTISQLTWTGVTIRENP